MTLLNGLEAPAGDGVVLEIHLDIIGAPGEFLEWLGSLGFANDPFLEFYPQDYRLHYTGRTRVPQSAVHAVLPELRALVAQILSEAQRRGVGMYAESELVRRIQHFPTGEMDRGLGALDELVFEAGAPGAEVKADVHVEFTSGTVPAEVRALLLAKRFYWVRTPRTERFPSEEIATLQTEQFHEATEVYERLVALPLPQCTGIHLEQKLRMEPSRAGLRMPEAVAVRLTNAADPT